MKSVTDKVTTLRKAVATSTVMTKPATTDRLMNNDVPKKDVLAVARVAGIQAAKKTPELLPYCHPIPIDVVEIDFEVSSGKIVVTASVEAIWKTGVEMEALTAASVAALTIYDMLKPIDTEMEIVWTRLLEKKGGKSDFVEKIPKGFKAAVLVASDGTFKGTREDRSGKIIKGRLESFGIEPGYTVLPDDKALIAATMNRLCDEGVLLIISTGGTGLGPRDVTVEATREIIDREIPGIMEAARAYGQERTPYSMLSRGLAGQRGNTIIVNLPGSSKGVEESLNAIFPAVLHSYKMMRGLGHEIASSGAAAPSSQ
jgi:molybdenum cofactor biosynthesis protein MoaC